MTSQQFLDNFCPEVKGITFKLNSKIRNGLKDKINSKFMEWFCALILFLNILWAVYIDFNTEYLYRWLNAVSGVIIALTVPLPSSVHKSCPGWIIIEDRKRFDVMVADNDWWWITIYTSWNWLFAWT